MNRLNRFLLQTLVVLSVRGPLRAQWVQTGGTPGPVTCFAASDTNLFAGTPGGGVFLSTNDGARWTAVNTGLPLNARICALVADTHRTRGSIVYAVVEDDGVYATRNNGANWVNIGTRNFSVLALAVIANGSGTPRLVIGSMGGMFLSTNGGEDWIAGGVGLPPNTFVGSLAVSDTNLFAGVFGLSGSLSGGVYRSTNNGTTWTEANTGLPPNASVTTFGVNPFGTGSTNLFVGTNDGSVFVSPDNGSHWTRVNLPPRLYASAFAFIGTNLFLGTQGGVIVSGDNGIDWDTIGLTGQSVSALAIPPRGASLSGRLFAGTTRGVFSTSDGRRWAAVNNGLTNGTVDLIATVPNGGGGTDVIAGSDYSGFFRSSDDGANWSAALAFPNNGFGRVTVLTESPGVAGGTNLFAGTAGAGVLVSTDGGVNWNTANSGLTNLSVSSLAASPFGTDRSNLFAGTVTGDILLSTNAGTSWVETGSMNSPIGLLAVSPNGSESTGLDGIQGTNLFAGTSQGFFLSTDKGKSWVGSDSGLKNAVSFAICPEKPRTEGTRGNFLFVGTYGGGLFRSTSAGTDWVNVGFLGDRVSGLAVYGGTLFAGVMGRGVFLSTDEGTSWAESNTGLTNVWVECLATGTEVTGPDGLSSKFLYAGTSGGGVWKFRLPDVISSVATHAPAVAEQYTLEQNYPNPFNPSTVVSCQLPVASNLKLVIYDVIGREVAVLMDERKEAGTYSVRWNAAGCASGVYICQMRAGSYLATRKLMLVK